MGLFSSLGEGLHYSDILQLDGAFSTAHIMYGKAPEFNGRDGRRLAQDSRANSVSAASRLDNVFDAWWEFDGTEAGCSESDCLELWKSYWLEYIRAFDLLTAQLPRSVVTAYVGRHALELGFKYIILEKGETIPPVHRLGELSRVALSGISDQESYLKWVIDFCEQYSRYIEGGKVEYFRFPDYGGGRFFAGNRLDIHWLSYNFALILLKQIHYVGLDNEFGLQLA